MVTRDGAAIKQKVEEKYKVTVRFEGHTTQGYKYRDFSDYPVLLAAPTGNPGEFNADPAKVGPIVDACLQLVESQFLVSVWHDNTVDVGVPDRVVQWAKDTWFIDPALSRPFLADL